MPANSAGSAVSNKRDVRYMQKTLDGILAVWAKYPELRLGQLLHIATALVVNNPWPFPAWEQDTFNIEDAELLKKLQDADDRLSSRR